MKALGLDLGTTSLSAVVLETDSGVLAAKTVQNAAFLPGERWERTQNAEEIYAAALPLVQELVCEHPEICAIGVTGQMHGIVYLDTDGRCLSPALHVAGRTGSFALQRNRKLGCALVCRHRLSGGAGLRAGDTLL